MVVALSTMSPSLTIEPPVNTSGTAPRSVEARAASKSRGCDATPTSMSCACAADAMTMAMVTSSVAPSNVAAPLVALELAPPCSARRPPPAPAVWLTA